MVHRHRRGWHAKHRTGRDERRYEHGRDAHTKPLEIKPVLTHGIIGRDGPKRRSDVIITTAVLVVGDDQQSLIPLRSVAKGIVEVVNQLLAEDNIVIRVLAVAGRLPTRL